MASRGEARRGRSGKPWMARVRVGKVRQERSGAASKVLDGPGALGQGREWLGRSGKPTRRCVWG